MSFQATVAIALDDVVRDQRRLGRDPAPPHTISCGRCCASLSHLPGRLNLPVRCRLDVAFAATTNLRNRPRPLSALTLKEILRQSIWN